MLAHFVYKEKLTSPYTDISPISCVYTLSCWRRGWSSHFRTHHFTRRAILLSLSRKYYRKKYRDCVTSQEQAFCVCVKRVLFETYLLRSTVSGTHTSSGDRLISSIQPYWDLFHCNSGSNQACIGKEKLCLVAFDVKSPSLQNTWSCFQWCLLHLSSHCMGPSMEIKRLHLRITDRLFLDQDFITYCLLR